MFDTSPRQEPATTSSWFFLWILIGVELLYDPKHFWFRVCVPDCVFSCVFPLLVSVIQRQYTSEKLSHCTNQTITFKRLILGLSPLNQDIVRLRPQKTYIICEKGCLIYSCNELKAREHILVQLRFSETTLEAAYVDRCALFQVSLGCRWPSSNFMGKCLRSCRIVALNMRTSIQHYKKRSILLLLSLLLLPLLQLLLLLLLIIITQYIIYI